jgi:hypothetical protein
LRWQSERCCTKKQQGPQTCRDAKGIQQIAASVWFVLIANAIRQPSDNAGYARYDCQIASLAKSATVQC